MHASSCRLLFPLLLAGCSFRVQGVNDRGGVDLGALLDLGAAPDLANGTMPSDLASARADLVSTGPLDLASPPPDLALLRPVLIGSITTPANNLTVDLTAQGSSDWAHWGLGGATGFNHKATGGSQISNFQNLQGNNVTGLTGYPVVFSWNDGTPTTSTNPTTTAGVYIAGNSQGFGITVPADNTKRTLTLFLGGQQSTGAVLAHLSDSSAPDYSSSAADNQMLYERQITLVYRAASAGQTLNVQWTVQSGQFVHLNAATLAVTP